MVEQNRLGTILFVVSESVFFILLVLAYALYHGVGPGAAASLKQLDPVKTGLLSLALFASSATLWRAAYSFRCRRSGRGTAWLAGTIVLGGVFLVGQVLEYVHLFRQQITIGKNLFASTFFTLTGFHGLHVFLGLIMLSMLLGLAIFGAKHEPAQSATESVSVYWHFVDGVWVVIFSVIYLWGFL